MAYLFQFVSCNINSYSNTMQSDLPSLSKLKHDGTPEFVQKFFLPPNAQSLKHLLVPKDTVCDTSLISYIQWNPHSVNS